MPAKASGNGGNNHTRRTSRQQEKLRPEYAYNVSGAELRQETTDDTLLARTVVGDGTAHDVPAYLGRRTRRQPLPRGCDSGVVTPDVIRLYFPDVSPKFTGYSRFKVTYNHERPSANRYLWTTANGVEVFGIRATCYKNGVWYRLSRGRTGKLELRIQFSATRIRWGHNARPVNQKQLRAVVSRLQRDCNWLRLRVDVSRAKMSVLELNSNWGLQRPVTHYLSVWKMLKVPFSRHNRAIDYATGFRRGCQTAMFCPYDKRAEVQFGLDKARARGEQQHVKRLRASLAYLDTQGDYVLRVELRLRSARAIKERLGFNTLGELVEAFDQLALYFYQALNDRGFRAQEFPKALPKVSGNGKNPEWGKLERQLFEEMHLANDTLNFLSASGAFLIAQKVGPAAFFRQLHIRELNANVEGRILHKIYTELGNVRTDCGATVGELYKELESVLFPNGRPRKMK